MKISVQKSDFLPHISCSVDFEMKGGTVLLMKGENGVGKSTLAKEIFKSLTTTSVLIRQEELDLFYDRTLKQIKKIYSSSAGEELDNERFLKFWSKFGLDKKEDRLQSQLSGGESQMLKICMGAFLKKELIILDEPSQNLDSSMQKVLNEMVEELCSLQKNILIIEHDTGWLSPKAEVMNLQVKDQILTGEKH